MPLVVRRRYLTVSTRPLPAVPLVARRRYFIMVYRPMPAEPRRCLIEVPRPLPAAMLVVQYSAAAPRLMLAAALVVGGPA